MKGILSVFMLLAIVINSSFAQKANKGIKYPSSKKQNVIDMFYGTKVVDPYRWLEDGQSDQTKKWITEQNELTQSYIKKISFREKINKRLNKLWNYEKRSTPFKGGNYYFQFQNNGLQDQHVLYYSDNSDGPFTVFLDPNKMSTDGSVALHSTSVSNDGKYLAYGVSHSGSDWTEFYIKDVEENRILSDHIKWSKYSNASWYKDGFYYQKFDEPMEGENALTATNTFAKIYYHRVGKPQLEDKLIFSDPQNPKRYFDTYVTPDERFLVIYGHGATAGNIVIVKDLSIPNALLSMIIDNFDNDHSIIGNIGEELLMLTNYDAPNYRLVRINPKQTHPRNWQDIIPESENVLSEVRYSGGKLIANHLVDASNRLSVYQLDGSLEKEIELSTFSAISLGRSHPTDSIIHFSQSSCTSPTEIYKYNLEDQSLQIAFKPKVDIDSEQFVTKQIFYQSKDGTKVPMFIFHKKDLQLDGNNPALLFGYGGFNISMTPSFSLFHYMFIENNGIVAIPNIRGGGEYGEYWHKLGIKKLKQNSFDDFIAAAEYLIQNKYTSKEKLAMRGGSNGGLLVGACMNQRPDLFKVALPAVGVMDMVRYHKFTVGWAYADDYGTSDNEEEFKTLYAYSPLHNITEQTYPATLVTTSDHDDRVVPAHSFKFAATLQEKASKVNPALIRIEMKGGHGAGLPVSKRIEAYTDELSFTFYNLGIVPK